MPEEMAPGARARSEARALERVPYHPPDRASGSRAETVDGIAERHWRLALLGATALHVGDQGVSHVLREWQAARPVGLAGADT